MAPKVIFKISIATNAPLPFIHRFIKKEENKKEVLETFEKEEISNHLLDANKQVPKYEFFQEFFIIDRELKGNESVSRGDNWFVIPQREFLLEPNDTFEVKRYHVILIHIFQLIHLILWIRNSLSFRVMMEGRKG